MKNYYIGVAPFNSFFHDAMIHELFNNTNKKRVFLNFCG